MFVTSEFCDQVSLFPNSVYLNCVYTFIQNSVLYPKVFFFRFFGIPMEILPNVRSSSEIYGLMVKEIVGGRDFIKKERPLPFRIQQLALLCFIAWDLGLSL